MGQTGSLACGIHNSSLHERRPLRSASPQRRELENRRPICTGGETRRTHYPENLSSKTTGLRMYIVAARRPRRDLAVSSMVLRPPGCFDGRNSVLPSPAELPWFLVTRVRVSRSDLITGRLPGIKSTASLCPRRFSFFSFSSTSSNPAARAPLQLSSRPSPLAGVAALHSPSSRLALPRLSLPRLLKYAPAPAPRGRPDQQPALAASKQPASLPARYLAPLPRSGCLVVTPRSGLASRPSPLPRRLNRLPPMAAQPRSAVVLNSPAAVMGNGLLQGPGAGMFILRPPLSHSSASPSHSSVVSPLPFAPHSPEASAVGKIILTDSSLVRPA